MELRVEWGAEIPLEPGTPKSPIYSIDFERLPERPGVYVFGRRWGNTFEAIYVGRANNIRRRIKSQLNNAKLMHHIKHAGNGAKVVFAGEFKAKQRQQALKCISLIEQGLIRYYISEGHNLVNISGTRLTHDEIVSSGDAPRRFIPARVIVK